MDTDLRRELRGALARADGPAIVAAVEAIDLERFLQFAGDALLIALGQDAPGAGPLAKRCARALRERAFEGDDQLAAELDAALGARDPTALVELPVDLEELSELLEDRLGGGGGRIDLQTGEVWTQSAIEYQDEIGEPVPDEEDERWLWVEPEGSAEGYRDMEDFIATRTNPGVAERLAIAIDGSGAFRRFKDVLMRWPDEEDDWYRFSDERRRGRARVWLADAGYRLKVPNTPRASG